jgi:hypothetical protein
MGLGLLLVGLLAAPVATPPSIVSSGPESVSVSVYRSPYRSPSDPIGPDEDSLSGYALVTELRTVILPKGPVTIRFEGVASGIQPETALVTGTDPREKNQDRRLLSQTALIDAFTGQQVILRRTNRGTGKVSEQLALIRSGTDGVIVQTEAGFESLQCTGLAETLIFPGVPEGLSAKPVLSITTGDQPGGPRQLTLSYLAGNFDWQANYVGELSPDATSMKLFAWVTLASRDDTSFVGARTNAIAGQVAREQGFGTSEGWVPSSRLFTNCQSSNPAEQIVVYARRAEYGDGGDGDIVVTGSRIHREQLGDLKLYRIDFPVTFAARSQKQVAFLSRPRVRGELVYRSEIDSDGDASDPQMLFRFRNRTDQGLGEPLPAGKVILFKQARGERLLLGESSTADKAVGEAVELAFGEPANISVINDELEQGESWTRHSLMVANANPFPITYEARFRDDPGARLDAFGGRVVRADNAWVWRIRIGANSRQTLRYRATEVVSPDD